MASAFSQALVGASLASLWSSHAPKAVSYFKAGGPLSKLDDLAHGQSAARREKILRLLPYACAVLAASPDFDVLMHAFVRYEDPLGHRGAFHSGAFYFVVASLVSILCGARLWAGSLAFVTLVSHSLLDMLTTGGLGIALFWPFTNERYFFPWRVIPVSPLSVSAFLSAPGLRILSSELAWAVPCFLAGITYHRLVGKGETKARTR